MIIFDVWSWMLLIPAALFAFWAQTKVKSTYAKYSQVGTRSGLSGAETAARVLRDAGVDDTEIERVAGELTDHYDPRDRTLRLSDGVYSSRSVAALGIAAHEAGHAIQHANSYAPLALRSIIYPVTGIGSTLAWPLFIAGFFFQSGLGTTLMNLGILLFSGAVLFTLVTLPVEFNASSRALRALADGGYLDEEELSGARKVLSAAAMTYVASAAMAIMQLVRMLILRGNE